jgi:hypothetical protein
VSLASKKIKHSQPLWQQQRQTIIDKSRTNFDASRNANPYDANSVVNPYGRYGSQLSPDSIDNPYGAGSRYNHSSPNNPCCRELAIIGR